MFDLTPPVRVKGPFGDSLIRIGDHFESCQIYMGDGVEPSDFVTMWAMECDAICHGRRNSGILATQIERDCDGRWGCVAGWLVLRQKDEILVFDGASIGFREGSATFGKKAKDWWRCVRFTKRMKAAAVWKRVPFSEFRDWCKRIRALSSAMESTGELIEDEARTRTCNRRKVLAILGKVNGGRELQARFPNDFMERMHFVSRGFRRREYEMGGEAGSHDFGRKLYPGRNDEMLRWWMHRQFSQGAAVIVFLKPHGAVDNGVSVGFVRRSDAETADLHAMVERSRIASKAVDCIALSAMRLPNGFASASDAISPVREFKRLLRSVHEVVLGVCDGTSWAAFKIADSLAVDGFRQVGVRH